MTTADVSVRPALTSDLPALTDIQLAAWAGVLGAAAVSQVEHANLADQWGRALADPDPRRRVLVALDGARVVGFAAASPTARSTADEAGWTGEIVALEVTPQARRSGHASRLLAALADLSRDGGAHHLGAWALREDSARRAFLEGAGFAEAGLRRVLALPGGGEAEEILLTASL